MTQNIQNYNNNVGYGTLPRVPASNPQKNVAVRIPEYYAEEQKNSFVDLIKDSPFYSIGIKGFFGPLIEHPIASLFTWFGCGYLLDKYTSACGGEYDKSLLKKVTNFGDNIENSKFVQSKPMQTILGFMKKSGKNTGNLMNKSAILRAMRYTPTMPEWEMVKSEMLPQRQRVVHDFNQIVHVLELNTDKSVALNKLALNKDERKLLKSMADKLNTEEKAASYIQLKRLGKTDTEIMSIISKQDGGVADTKNAILKAFGNKNKDWLNKIHEDTIGKYIDEVQSATKRVGGKVKIGLGKFAPFGINLGPLTLPGERVVSCDSVANRLISLDPSVKGGAKTATGRFMSRFMQMVHRGLTFGGGKYGVLLFIAPAFVETAINVHKAEPNEKVGTGVSNLVNHISWVFTFPFALQIMHHICGAKYAGLTDKQVQNIRKKVSDFNKKNKNREFKDYADWNKQRIDLNNEIKIMSKVKGQKWYTKCIRKLAGLLTHDLGKVDAYNTGNMVATKFSQLRNLPRNLWGVPVRLVIFGLLSMGLLDTILNKCIKFIFGNSYDSMKEEEIKDAKKEQKKFLKEDLTERLYEAQRKKILNSAKPANQTQIQNNPQANVISHHGSQQMQQNGYEQNENQDGLQYRINPETIPQTEETKIDNYTYIPSQDNIIKSESGRSKLDNYSYIPSQNSTIQSKGDNNSLNIRTYVPSQKAANITKSWDNSGLQSALNRADRAEQRALKVLSGNFEGM